MKGELMLGYEVELDPRVASIGGSWTATVRDGRVLAWDQGGLAFFHARMLEHEAPFVLDAGASTGSFCLLAKYHPGATVLAFEPEPVSREFLESNIRLNGLEDRVRVLPFALSDEDGAGVLKVPAEARDRGQSSLGSPHRFRAWNEVEVERRRLDGLGVGAPDIIKMDVEGCELFALKGGENLIRAARPGIFVEVCGKCTRQFGYEPDEIIRLLLSWGYDRREKAGLEDFWLT